MNQSPNPWHVSFSYARTCIAEQRAQDLERTVREHGGCTEGTTGSRQGKLPCSAWQVQCRWREPNLCILVLKHESIHMTQ
ncbi:hypothetical protein LINPERHAP1_LOCUS20883 [Linum perenne]